jgi:hypothetical protein
VGTHWLIEQLPAIDIRELLSPNEEMALRLNGVDLPGLTAHFAVVQVTKTLSLCVLCRYRRRRTHL